MEIATKTKTKIKHLTKKTLLGCIYVMRRSAKGQDVIDVVQKTLHAGLIAWAKVCGDALI